LGEVFTAIAAEATSLFPQPVMGDNLVPVQTVDDPALKVAVGDIVRLLGVDAEVYVGERVPGGAVVLAFPRRILVVDREVLLESDSARRFLFGWALEAIRGGYALLFTLGPKQRGELGSLLRSLLLPEAERAGPTNDFVRALPKRAIKVIESCVGKGRDGDIDSWFDGMFALAKRAGLFAADDFVAATRMIARLAGDLPAGDGTVALGAVLGGPDLIRFYLSDDYQHLRDVLSTSPPGM
jgi:hypothetical protein